MYVKDFDTVDWTEWFLGGEPFLEMREYTYMFST